MLLQGMGELVSVNILQRDEYEPSSWKTICTPNPMYVSLALETKSMCGACIQHYDSMRSSWRSPRRQNLSCSTCLDHPRTVWAMKTVSLTVRIALWLFLFQGWGVGGYSMPTCKNISIHFNSYREYLVWDNKGTEKTLYIVQLYFCTHVEFM